MLKQTVYKILHIFTSLQIILLQCKVILNIDLSLPLSLNIGDLAVYKRCNKISEYVFIFYMLSSVGIATQM